MTAIFQPSPYASFLQETKIKLSNGQELHVETGGNPQHPSILLIMGLGAQMLLWPEEFCKQLIDAGYHVIRFDNRDIGLSSKIRKKGIRLNRLKLMARFAAGLKNEGAPYTLYDMAEDVSLLIDALKLEKVHVVGASMGGMISQILAAKYPNKIASVSLLFTSNNQRFLPPPFPKQLFSLIGKPKSHSEEDMILHSIKLFNNIGSPGHINQVEIAQFARTLYRRSFNPAGVLQQFLAILCTGSLLHLDKQIQQPTIVVHGSLDRLLPPAHGRAVAKAIPNAKFELIEGMGHDIQPYFIPKLVHIFTQHIQSLNP